ncbi:MAG: hypothetical protein Q9166_007957 [cf. Caloplaca sp. 2 TL-2023]
MDGRQWNPNLPSRTRGRATPRDSHERYSGHQSSDHFARFVGDEDSGRYHSSSQRGVPNRRSREQDMSLEDGILELFEVINEAINIFAHFNQDYQQDVQRIRKYCDKHLIDAVWMQKVCGGSREAGDPRRRHRGEQDEDMDRTARQSPSLRSTMKQLLSSVELALNAAQVFRPSPRRPSRYTSDDVVKIQEQLHRTYQNLRRSFPIVTERRSEMEHVSTELEMLRLFLGRNGAADGVEDVARGGGHGGGSRRPGGFTGGSHVGFEEEAGEQVEEWSGGQDAGKGEPKSSSLDYAS